jgi:sec-independent protein translocase protein TatB
MLANVFNLSGSEMVFILLLALVILGPDKLPDALRRAGKAYAEFKKVTTGFQTELKNALEEPMREMRETTDLMKQTMSVDQFDPRKNGISQVPPPSAAPAVPADGETAAPSALNFGAGPPPASDAFGTVPASERSATSPEDPAR